MKDNRRLKRRVRNSYIVSTVSMALVLFLLGSVGYLMTAALRVARTLQESVTVTVELADGVDSLRRGEIERRLRGDEMVRDIEFVSKQTKIGDAEFRHMFENEIEEVLDTAAPLGFKAVIVDDGWQMEDSQRSYAYCGDWEVSPAKIKDMKAHVARVHAMGLKYYLWYSVPFVGVHSRAYETFKGKYFGSGDTVVLDPRYPDVREYLISKYENAVKDWDLDGFKLDFIDSFRQPENEAADAAPGRDYVSVPQAVDRLMTDIKKRLQALKPNIAIEFRQSYVGPLMRKYGNMFRAADCANDTVINKIRTMDTRLCVGTSTVHSDMITWSREDTAESACLQFIATMFAVPQISVRPATLPEEHRLMMQNWIAFWESHRDTLLDAKLRLYSPELLYPIATAESETSIIAAI